MTPEEMAARLDGMVKVFPPLASKAVRKTAFDIQATAKTLAPFDTGNLRNSITVENLGPYASAIGPTAAYGRYVEEGTGPHIIKPRNARALHFNGIFTSRVSHPGTRPQPYMRPAAEKHLPGFMEALGAIFK